MTQVSPPLFDLIGIGFGPSNLALAVALQEAAQRDATPLNHCFLERQNGFLWHGDMLLDNSRMQISFLKDLATLRNPLSRFTFINYLHAKHRLADFINLKTFFPSRHEFNDYLAWVAEQFAPLCHYGEEVIGVEPEFDAAGDVDCLRLRSRTGAGERLRRTRHLVIGVGGTALIPPACRELAGDARVFHSSTYLSALARLRAPRRIAVIGAGQSAVEIFLDLNERFPETGVDLICRAHALKPSDDSPFVNEIFNPEYVDYVYGQPEPRRRELLAEFANTNYAAGDSDLIEAIYRLFYQQKVRGQQRHRFLRRCEVSAARAGIDGIALELRHIDSAERQRCQYDALVLATGYERQPHRALLEPVRPWLDDFCIERNYRLRTKTRFRPEIFVQGGSEDSHGLSDTLLSILPIRAQEIIDALRENRHGERRAEARDAAVSA